eukprot:TRINITY_DN9083_c0_g1_i3.p1 TRINITY_DN9083_c0_g1~~TRINITY_DN9083_c0_g1_i3.p1  ORF type:complete len:132 (-),score=13.89 TRINITY_DN9083_c0_g1_i3:20-415(-)
MAPFKKLRGNNIIDEKVRSYLTLFNEERSTANNGQYYKLGQLVAIRNQNAVKDTLWLGPGKVVAFDGLAGFYVEFNNKVTKRNIQDMKEWTTVNSEKILPRKDVQKNNMETSTGNTSEPKSPVLCVDTTAS